MGSVFRWLGLFGVAQVIGLASSPALPLEITAADPDGAAALVGAPISAPVTLSASQRSAATAGRLSLKEKREQGAQEIPVQFEPSRAGEEGGRLWWLMPEGAAGSRNFLLQESPDGPPALQTGSGEVMRASKNSATGQYEIRQAGKPVLGYNYQTNHPGELLAKIHPDNLKYARPRGDYIHPLFGLDGEELTKDWSVDQSGQFAVAVARALRAKAAGARVWVLLALPAVWQASPLRPVSRAGRAGDAAVGKRSFFRAAWALKPPTRPARQSR